MSGQVQAALPPAADAPGARAPTRRRRQGLPVRDAVRAASAAASGIRGGRRSGAHRFGGWAGADRPVVHAADAARYL